MRPGDKAGIAVGHTAQIAHALATHSSDGTGTLPQSIEGVNISMPGSYPASLHRDGFLALHAAESPLSVAEQFEFVCVMLLDGGAVADADQNRVR